MDAAVMSRPLFAPLMVVAAIALGQALQLSNGHFRPVSLMLLTVALVASFLALLLPESRHARLVSRAGRATVIVLGAGLVWQLIQLATSAPAIDARPGRAWLVAVFIGAASAAVLIGAELGGTAWLATLRLPLLVAVHFALGF